jgi:hypothetical protein
MPTRGYLPGSPQIEFAEETSLLVSPPVPECSAQEMSRLVIRQK